MEVRRDIEGGESETCLGPEVRWYMDGGEHKSSVLGEVRWDLDGAEMQFSGPGSGPGWSRDVT